MARATIIITESSEELAELLNRPENASYAPRLRMLALLKADPRRTLDAVAAELGISARSIYRWWGLYRKEGLAGLLGNAPSTPPKRRKIGEREMAELKEKLLAGELDGLRDIQEWLERQYGVHYSLKGISEVLRRMGVEKRWGSQHNISVDEGKRNMRRADINEIAELFNDQPVSQDVRSSIVILKKFLQDAFPEIDRISVAVNVACDLINPVDYSPANGIMYSVDIESERVRLGIFSTPNENFRNVEYQMNECRRLGLPIDDYWPPVVLFYMFNGAYVGRIFLWRDLLKNEMSHDVLDEIERLRSIITYIMTDIVLRYNYANPSERMFYEGFHRLVDESGISVRERRILQCRLVGFSYKEIADMVSISEDSVKKAIRSIHRKTNTRGHVELVAKYFTPRLFPSEKLLWEQREAQK